MRIINRGRGAIFILLCMLITLSAHATDLMDIYQQAAQSDPTYQAAVATRLANREAMPQSIANWLPSVSADANTTFNKNYTAVTNAPSQQQQNGQGGWQSYNSNGYTVTLSQTLFNFADVMRVVQARSTNKQADATLAAAAQDLMIRTATAYFKVLYAQDNLEFSKAQEAATGHQLDQVQQRFAVGMDAMATLENARATHDSAVAQVISAENDLLNSEEAMRQLTGRTYLALDGLKITIPLLTPEPNDVEQWVATAERQNVTLLAANYAETAARDAIKVNFAGHLPSVSAVGSYNKLNGQNQGAIFARGTSAGLQLNLPIFSGGLVNSQVRQAQDNFQVVSENRESAYRQTMIMARQEFNDVLSGISKLQADRQAVASHEASLDSTEEAFKVGTRTIIDVSLEIQALYQAKRNYSQDEYNYLLSTLQLKQAAGTLSPNDLAGINRWLHAQKAEPISSKKPLPK